MHRIALGDGYRAPNDSKNVWIESQRFDSKPMEHI